jgi:glutamine synthetase
MMPKNLLEAVHTLEADQYMCEALGPELVEGFSYLKNKEWECYMSHLSQWEMDYYFNC